MDYFSELNIRCDYFSRGCLEFVQLGDLERHVKDCGFTPVLCSNEGCVVEMNKRDRTHHETEVCEFRKVKCHDCSEIRKEVDKMKVNLMEQTQKLDEMKTNITTISNKMEDIKQKVDELAALTVNIENMKLDEMKTKMMTISAKLNKMEALAVLPAYIEKMKEDIMKKVEALEQSPNDQDEVSHVTSVKVIHELTALEEPDWFETNMLNEEDFWLKDEVEDFLIELEWVRSFYITGKSGKAPLVITTEPDMTPSMKQLQDKFGVKIESYVEFIEGDKCEEFSVHMNIASPET